MFKDLQGAGCVVESGAPTLSCIFPLFQNIITAALLFAGVVALIFIIWAGIQLINSQGDQQKVQSARNILTYAILGLVLILSSFAILRLISYLTGVDCIQSFGFNQCQ